MYMKPKLAKNENSKTDLVVGVVLVHVGVEHHARVGYPDLPPRFCAEGGTGGQGAEFKGGYGGTGSGEGEGEWGDRERSGRGGGGAERERGGGQGAERERKGRGGGGQGDWAGGGAFTIQRRNKGEKRDSVRAGAEES